MLPPAITVVRLTEIPLDTLVAHMSDPRMAGHMPLLTRPWTRADAARFVQAKEECWARDGLGHQAILLAGRYVGWGGFQKEGEDWDFGLVLTPDAFGLGGRITRDALAWARSDPRIPRVTFLLPPSRKKLKALHRLGAVFVGEVEHEGAVFRKYRVETGGDGGVAPGAPPPAEFGCPSLPTLPAPRSPPMPSTRGPGA